MNYDVERKTLDRPETVSRLETVISELVGKPIRVRFRTTEAIEVAKRPNLPAAPVQRTQIIEEPEDPYLQDVTRTFGVKSWKVKELVVEAAESDPGETGPE